MFNPLRTLGAHRRRRFWLTELLLIAAILAVGSTALLQDVRIMKSWNVEHTTIVR